MNDKLIPIEYKGQRILTTELIAQSYEVEERKITDNFNNNKKRYIDGKHYFLLKGEELRFFKSNYEIFGIAPNVNKLYLWTERGALLHAKSLNTDKAWEVYEELEDTYFKVQELKENIELIPANEEIEKLKETLSDFKRATEEAKEMYKPSHKRKLQYDRLIKSVTSDKEEYDIVKEWIFAALEIEKWEDTSIDQNRKILEIISTVSRMLNIKKFEQITLF
ncbi:ORF6N domain-containing protein [uncultured Clostridium sp.]|uniref:ORF6N domain-containing protein n=1 Tax=uncultured Clostridium sp. TaxID=59620 RepID=UPI0028EE0E07|nr:ORF6N domain-containing protein [uncultured Clostridium sp.]